MIDDGGPAVGRWYLSQAYYWTRDIREAVRITPKRAYYKAGFHGRLSYTPLSKVLAWADTKERIEEISHACASLDDRYKDAGRKLAQRIKGELEELGMDAIVTKHYEAVLLETETGRQALLEKYGLPADDLFDRTIRRPSVTVSGR